MEKIYSYEQQYTLANGETRTRICRCRKILKGTKSPGRPVTKIENANEILMFLEHNTKKATCSEFNISYYKLGQIVGRRPQKVTKTEILEYLLAGDINDACGKFDMSLDEIYDILYESEDDLEKF